VAAGCLGHLAKWAGRHSQSGGADARRRYLLVSSGYNLVFLLSLTLPALVVPYG